MTGTYYLRTSNSPGYVDELNDNLSCTGGTCPAATTGTGVSVTTGRRPAGSISPWRSAGRSPAQSRHPVWGHPCRAYRCTLRRDRRLSGTFDERFRRIHENGPAGGHLLRPHLEQQPHERVLRQPAHLDEHHLGDAHRRLGRLAHDGEFALDVNTGPNTSATAVVLPLGTTENLHYTSGTAPDTIWYSFRCRRRTREGPAGERADRLAVSVPPPSGWRSDLDFDLLDAALAVRAIALSGSDNETLYLHNVAPAGYDITRTTSPRRSDSELPPVQHLD